MFDKSFPHFYQNYQGRHQQYEFPKTKSFLNNPISEAIYLKKYCPKMGQLDDYGKTHKKILNLLLRFDRQN